MARVVTCVAGLVLGGGLVYYGLIKWEKRVQYGFSLGRWVAVPIVLGYVTIGLYQLLRGVGWREIVPRPWSLLLAAAPVVGVAIVTKLMAGPNDLPMIEFFRRSVLVSIIFPGLPLVAHTIYFGPAVLLLLLLWNKVADAARELGLGLVAFLALGLALSLNTESRVITQFLPAFVLPLTLVLSRRELPRWGWIATGVLALAFSKVWLEMAGPDRVFGQHYMFPAQRYFMNMGPWMSGTSFAIQAVATLIALVVLMEWIYPGRLKPALTGVWQRLRDPQARGQYLQFAMTLAASATDLGRKFWSARPKGKT